jgi:hypothetical protein
MKRVPPFILLVRDFKSKCRFGDTIDFRGKVPPFIMEKGNAIREEKLQVAYLRGVDCGIVDLGYTTSIERVPNSAGGRIGCTDCNFGSVCPTRLNARATWRAM